MVKEYIKRSVRWYFTKNALPYWCMLLMDSGIFVASGMLTYWVLHRSQNIFDNRIEVFCSLILYMLVCWIGARLFHTYQGVVRYSSFVDLMHLAYSNLVSLAISLLLSELFEYYQITLLSGLNQTDILITFFIATLAMWGVRILVKTVFDVVSSDERTKRVLIYGALSDGVGLAKNMRTQRPVRFRLCGFISPDDFVRNLMLLGKPIYGLDADFKTIIRKQNIQAVLVSTSRLNDFRHNQYLQDILIDYGVSIFMAQQAKEAQVKDGELKLTDSGGMSIREVSVEDLLPRDEIRVDMKSVGELLTGTTVLVTGAAGSIGSEIVRQVANFKPACMILIDQAESPEHDIRLMMANDYPDLPALTIVTSISRKTRMNTLFGKYRPDYVFHAAAYKHVPMMEDNPSEAVLNNIYGTKVIADCAVKYGVKKFVMVSTDKAVNPTNVMGCSKRICEMYVQSLNNTQTTTQFITTRFGNVLGSNGSVIPLFKEQIKRGGPVTVTDENIVRYFMLIPEACKLVLEAGTKGNGGEIFVFDMGQPVKIVDLARRMIRLSGAKNVEIKFTGLRPGEKLYEEVLYDLEGTKPTFHEKIRVAEVRAADFEKVSKAIDELVEISKQYDNMATVKKMKEIVPEYKSKNSEYEVLDNQNS
jgi:FlaA1/EpsC-like NDP-sugar epimerase